MTCVVSVGFWSFIVLFGLAGWVHTVIEQADRAELNEHLRRLDEL